MTSKKLEGDKERMKLKIFDSIRETITQNEASTLKILKSSSGIPSGDPSELAVELKNSKMIVEDLKV